MNGGGGVVKYSVCIGCGFAGYCGGRGAYVCGCCAVIDSIAKRSSNFSLRVARLLLAIVLYVRNCQRNCQCNSYVIRYIDSYVAIM